MEDVAQDEAVFPIAEHFTSPQGEGAHAGRMMKFIRFAGCTVGRAWNNDEEKQKHNVLHVYQEKCTTYDGRTFACDTNYKVDQKMSVSQILHLIRCANVDRVCFTGGEPLMHKHLPQLASTITKVMQGTKVHIETSGTIPFGTNKPLEEMLRYSYVAISPKRGFLEEYMNTPGIVGEVKLLVDDKFDWAAVPLSIRMSPDKVFLQPINFENALDRGNVVKCIELQKQIPKVRISIQLHKILGVQ